MTKKGLVLFARIGEEDLEYRRLLEAEAVFLAYEGLSVGTYLDDQDLLNRLSSRDIILGVVLLPHHENNGVARKARSTLPRDVPVVVWDRTNEAADRVRSALRLIIPTSDK